MAHIRRPLGVAVALNTAVFVAETIGGLRAQSLSLLMDAVHNFSDELALVCLFLAYVLAARLSRGLQRSANLFNSIGLVAISAVVVWQALDRFQHPHLVVGWLPVTVGLLAAIGNWGVARVLRTWQIHNAAIRLAYLHNLGDMYISLAPVVAGILVTVSDESVFDPLIALSVAVWMISSTVREVARSSEVLLWPEDARCPHEEGAAA
jgi:cobalt-zinc-cadmium efflux system protein